jgi:peptidyl-tRNA hydrolase, PTH1 family
LGTKEFWRLRIGVDRPANQDDVADHVLHPFKKEEINLIENKADEIEKHIKEFLSK